MKKLDVKSLGCPLPVIYLRKALAKMEPGEQIEVLCNAKDALNDMRALVQTTGNVIVTQTTDATGKVPVYTLTVQRAA